MKRDDYQDGLRGIFLAIMAIDHLPIIFPKATHFVLDGLYEVLGYVSAAEGFVFLSGLVAGKVYTTALLQEGSGELARRALKRALSIYVHYCIFVILLVTLIKALGQEGLPWGSWAFLSKQPFDSVLWKVPLLAYQPNFMEILPMYSLLLLFTPWLITLIARRNRYATVIVGSTLLWLSAQFGLRDGLCNLLSRVLSTDLEPGFFNFFGWQILYVIGLCLGSRGAVRNEEPSAINQNFFLAGSLACVLLAFHRHHNASYSDPAWLYEKSQLGLLRIVNVLLLAYLLSALRIHLLSLVRRKWFVLLGRYSLQVFSIHLIPLFFLYIFWKHGFAGNGIWGQVITIGIYLWILVQTAFIAKEVREIRAH